MKEDKYIKFAKDLEIVKQAALLAAEENGGEDGGAFNFDTAEISLPRWKSQKVIEAGRKAGIVITKWGSIYHVCNPVAGQANRRTRAADAMCKTFTELGYNCYGYYQMD